MNDPDSTTTPAAGVWPPKFTLDQERILKLLTGDRFYSNPSAALREAVLNSIDAIHRRRQTEPEVSPEIVVVFDRESLTLSVSDNGVGMNQREIEELFTKVGASAATQEPGGKSVGEFGIGVVSYFMAGNHFELQTKSVVDDAIALVFSKSMLAGGGAAEVQPTRESRGTTVVITLRDENTFNTLLDSYPHWCRDVSGLKGTLLPDDIEFSQGGADTTDGTVTVAHPDWVERSELAPVSNPAGWEGMTGISTVSVLYRGVFVQEFNATGIWGIEGSIDVDPKHFKPRLNREGFVEGEFQSELEAFLKASHPRILEVMAHRLQAAVEGGEMGRWKVSRWANLWLSVPRSESYREATDAWDAVFRKLPAFEKAVGNQWDPISLEGLLALGPRVYLAPLAHEQSNDVVKAALHFLRNTGKPVIRGIRQDPSWMKHASRSYGTTADLIAGVFAPELPKLVSVAGEAENILDGIERVAPLFTGPPSVDLVQLGDDSAPVLRLRNRLVLNTDHLAAKTMVEEALAANAGPLSLIGISARHAYQQLTEVAAVVKDGTDPPEILGPIRRRFIRSLLS